MAMNRIILLVVSTSVAKKLCSHIRGQGVACLVQLCSCAVLIGRSGQDTVNDRVQQASHKLFAKPIAGDPRLRASVGLFRVLHMSSYFECELCSATFLSEGKATFVNAMTDHKKHHNHGNKSADIIVSPLCFHVDMVLETFLPRTQTF
jgi:hypothetical protein